MTEGEKAYNTYVKLAKEELAHVRHYAPWFALSVDHKMVWEQVAQTAIDQAKKNINDALEAGVI